MSRFKGFACALSLALLVGASYGADAIALLNAFAKNTVSASGEFLQKTLDEKGKETADVSEGRFAFARPGKFLWETRAPFPQLIVSDAKTLWIYDPDLKQVTVKTLQAQSGGSPAALLFGRTDLNETFFLEELPKKGDISWVRATPKKADSAYVSLEVGLDAKGEPCEMRVLDTFGMTNIYAFKRFTVPSDIPSTTFDFKIPAGADVLRDSSAQ